MSTEITILYTAEATAEGGRAGHARTSDGRLAVDLDVPTEMGGPGGLGTNPEQLFAVGYAACFEGAIGVVGRRMRADVGDVSIDSHVMLMPTEDRRMEIGVELHVSLPSVDDAEQAKEIVAAARTKVCCGCSPSHFKSTLPPSDTPTASSAAPGSRRASSRST